MSLPLLYLCRHGQTDWNAEGRLQGQEDIPLNALGRTQAKRNGRYLRNVLGERASDFRFVSSPMDRARETMRIIRHEMKLDPDAFEIEPRLIELNFGDWQGSTLAEVRTREPERVRARKADKWNFVPPGAAAESYAMLAARVRPVFQALERPTLDHRPWRRHPQRPPPLRRRQRARGVALRHPAGPGAAQSGRGTGVGVR